MPYALHSIVRAGENGEPMNHLGIPSIVSRISDIKDRLSTLDPDERLYDDGRATLCEQFVVSVANGVLKGEDARYAASLIVSELF